MGKIYVFLDESLLHFEASDFCLIKFVKLGEMFGFVV